MREHEDRPHDEIVDLGAATERTLGVWDPLLKESHDTPESFPM
jgi:hypothetical protein